MYRREWQDEVERAHTAALCEDRMRYWAGLVAKAQFGERMNEWDEHTRQVFVGSLYETIAQDGSKYEDAKRRLEHGVETKHGSHKRVVKLRAGHRYEWDYPSATNWWVIDRPADWLVGLEARCAAEVSEEWGVDVEDYDLDALDTIVRDARREVGERMDRAVAKLVQQEYGTYPEGYDTGMPEVSPSGRWFGYVTYRQVGTRLLVEERHSQDV